MPKIIFFCDSQCKDCGKTLDYNIEKNGSMEIREKKGEGKERGRDEAREGRKEVGKENTVISS